jgi:hypothetical protein
MKKSERYKNIEAEVQRVLGVILVPLIVLFVIFCGWAFHKIKREVDKA